MAMYDVDTLFTNIPLNETIGMCVNKLFYENLATQYGTVPMADNLGLTLSNPLTGDL